MRVLIFGNSGSGKTTLARQLATRHELPRLDLDTVVWEPGQVAVLSHEDVIRARISAFLAGRDAWVIEGCYGEWIEELLPRCSELIFLNPGLERCLANHARRPWEPEKYTSHEEQRAMLENLRSWVEGYYERPDPWSYAAHRRIFDGFSGPKRELLDEWSVAFDVGTQPQSPHRSEPTNPCVTDH